MFFVSRLSQISFARGPLTKGDLIMSGVKKEVAFEGNGATLKESQGAHDGEIIKNWINKPLARLERSHPAGQAGVQEEKSGEGVKSATEATRDEISLSEQ